MALSHEHIGSKISAKIKSYILSRAKFLCSLCHEIPCRTIVTKSEFIQKKLISAFVFSRLILLHFLAFLLASLVTFLSLFIFFLRNTLRDFRCNIMQCQWKVYKSAGSNSNSRTLKDKYDSTKSWWGVAPFWPLSIDPPDPTRGCYGPKYYA